MLADVVAGCGCGATSVSDDVVGAADGGADVGEWCCCCVRLRLMRFKTKQEGDHDGGGWLSHDHARSMS